MLRTRAAVAALALCALGPAGCAGTLESLGAALAYRHAPLSAENVRLDLPYRIDAAAHPDKHRLDLFLPAGEAAADGGWPTLLFVHGGGWTEGDRATRVLGIEPMRNIGRFYAARGIGVAVVGYRLQPQVSWREQVDDVAQATAWVHREIAARGGDPDALYLAGHSAGAWLAAWVGLDDAALARAGMDRSSLCGLVLVSGAGYDMLDAQTYALGAKRAYYERLFGDDDPDWAQAASILAHLDAPLPPTLVLSGAKEPPKFRRQGDLLFDALLSHGGRAQREVLAEQDHQRIVISMSRSGDPVSDAILAFLDATTCPAGSP